MFSGYWNKPGATAAAIRDGRYHTGDAGIRDKDGNLFLVDRLKDMIVSGGENIYSAEVERALMSHASVESAAVVGAPDEKWGERVVAFVVTNPGKPVDVSDLVFHLPRPHRGIQGSKGDPPNGHAAAQRERKGAESGSAPTTSGIDP
jgi:acyl-CoA synthetase (AMP-forming)/AMP-acid ligase II